MTPSIAAQLALHGIEVAAVVHGDALAGWTPRVLVRLVGDDHDALSTPSASTCAAIIADRHAAVERLAAGHRHGVVVEELEGDVVPAATAARMARLPEWM